MFDISFSELALCFVVALVVLGPERLPKLARTLGRWSGQARSYMRHLTAELERESHVAELKQQLESARREVESTGREIESSARRIEDSARTEADALQKDVQPKP